MRASILLFFCYIIFLCPSKVRYFLGYCFGILWFDVFRVRRRVAIENICIAFPDWTQDKVVRTARRSVIEQGYLIADFAEMAFISEKVLQQKIKFNNIENLENALQQNRGVFLLALHMSNGDYGIAGLSARGYPINLITKRFRSQWLDDLWFRIRGRFGTKFIAARDSSYDILKAVRSKEVVIFVLDQFMGPPLGLRTQFFGHTTGTAFGLALFARKTQAPVVPTFIQREADGTFRLTCLPAVPFEEKTSKDDTLQFMTQKYTDTIEDIVRKCPEQWLWIHRRWKPFND